MTMGSISHQTIIITGLVTTVVTVFGTYLLKKFRSGRVPTQWREVGEVKKLYLYPLKSGKRIEIDRATVTKRGFQEMEKFDKTFRMRDRCFVIYQEGTYEFRTARTHPAILLIEVQTTDIDRVVFRAPEMDDISVEIPNGHQEKIRIKQFKDEPVISMDCGDDIARWLSKYILKKDSGLRLAYNDGSTTRDITPFYQKEIEYYKRGLSNDATGLHHDLAAVHILSQTSVYDVNEKMGDDSVKVEHFRPNILVDGPDLQPFEEDDWQWVKVGDVVMRNVIECTRCIMTTLNYEQGLRRTDREPLKTLEKYRSSKGPSKSPVMGILLGVAHTGTVSVGDKVYIADA